MLNDFNILNNNHIKKDSKIDTMNNKSFNDRKGEISEKQNKISNGTVSDSMDNLDLFFTLLLKNFNSNERKLLLNKLLSIDWENSEENLEHHLKELINKKKSDDELKKSLDYEYFLWDFNNWKNYFLADDSK